MARQQKKVVCPENEGLVSFLLGRRDEMAEKKAISENLELTIYKAYSNICDSKMPLRALKDVSQVNSDWILVDVVAGEIGVLENGSYSSLQGYFRKDSEPSESWDSENTKKKSKGSKRYIPQKNSAAYALLITLYRGTMSGKGFMVKQELIDATESSGLSRVSIGYMLTEEGQEAARECLARSGIADCGDLTSVEGVSISARSIDAGNTVTSRPASKRAPKESAISSTTSDTCGIKKKHLMSTNSSIAHISQNQGCLSSESETLDSAIVADGTYMNVLSDESTLRPFSLQPCTSPEGE